MKVAKLKTHGRHHASNHMEAFVHGQELAAFCGGYDALESPEEDSPAGWEAFFSKRKSNVTAAGKRANDEKMAGFYVHMGGAGKTILSPTDITSGTIAEDLQTAAQVWCVLSQDGSGSFVSAAATRVSDMCMRCLVDDPSGFIFG
jgi:AbiV family abortive infection protein